MTAEEQAAFNGHVTGEIQYFDEADLYDDPDDGALIAVLVLTALFAGFCMLVWWVIHTFG